jgi:hypothetical protein
MKKAKVTQAHKTALLIVQLQQMLNYNLMWIPQSLLLKIANKKPYPSKFFDCVEGILLEQHSIILTPFDMEFRDGFLLSFENSSARVIHPHESISPIFDLWKKVQNNAISLKKLKKIVAESYYIEVDELYDEEEIDLEDDDDFEEEISLEEVEELEANLEKDTK